MSVLRVVFSLCLLAAIGCGDNLGPLGADGGPGDGDAGGADPSTAFAVGTDFLTAGVASTVSVPGLEVTRNAVAGVASTDPVVRLHGDRLYVINRFGHDNVTVLDAETLELVAQISTDPGSNPQDVAVDGDLIYVPTLAGLGVAVIDTEGEVVVDTIDLSFLDQDDDTPNCHTLALRGQHLIVVCGVLDDDTFEPRGNGRVVVVDLESGEPTDVLALDDQRPFGFGLALPAESALGIDFLVPTAPDFVDPDGAGCVQTVTINPADGSAALDCLVTNQELGGFAAGLAYDAARDRVWIAVTSGFDSDDFGPLGHLVAYDADAAELLDPVTDAQDRPVDVAVCPSGHLVVSEATRGVRVFTAGAEDELTRRPLDIALPPVANGLVCY